MSRFEEIIAKNCSDCVESKTLGEICVKTENITWDNNQKQEFKYIDLTSVNRHTHFIEETESIDAHNAPSRAQKIVCAEDVIFGTTRPTLKRYCFIPNEYNDQICSTGYCVLRADRNVVLPRFIFHHMGSERFCMYVEANQKGSAYPAISDSDIRNFTIPLPPLPIQQEIVRILDTFTSLEAELEAELEKRKQQYEYYRDNLLTLSDDVPMLTLGQIFQLKAGKFIQATDISEVKNDEYAFPCYGGNGLRGFVKTPNQNAENVLIGRQGALCGNTKRVSGKYYATEHAVVVTVKNIVNIDWAFYMLTSMNLNQYKSKSAQPGLSVEKIEQLKIPLPPLSEQERVASVLDRFDVLTNDITQGLPAEIAARRKQYEYYRDKLLTFKRKDAAV